jgi:hypothetical protein
MRRLFVLLILALAAIAPASLATSLLAAAPSQPVVSPALEPWAVAPVLPAAPDVPPPIRAALVKAVPPTLSRAALPDVSALKAPPAFVAATMRAQKIADSLNAALGIKRAAIGQTPQGITQGTARRMFPNVTRGRGWRLITGILRPTTTAGITTWEILNNSTHDPLGTVSVTPNSTGSQLDVSFDSAGSVVAWSNVVPDETCALFGVSCGTSQAVDSATVYVTCNREFAFRVFGSASSGTGAYSVTSSAASATSDHSIVSGVSYDSATGAITVSLTADNTFDTSCVTITPRRTNDSYLPEAFQTGETSNSFTFRGLNRGTGWFNGTANANLQYNVRLKVIGRPNLKTFDWGALGGLPNFWFAALVYFDATAMNDALVRSTVVAQAKSLDWHGKSLIRTATKPARPRPSKPVRVAR